MAADPCGARSGNCICHRAGTMAYYFRAIRSVLSLLRADAGALELTRTLVVGARKVRAQGL